MRDAAAAALEDSDDDDVQGIDLDDAGEGAGAGAGADAALDQQVTRPRLRLPPSARLGRGPGSAHSIRSPAPATVPVTNNTGYGSTGRSSPQPDASGFAAAPSRADSGEVEMASLRSVDAEDAVGFYALHDGTGTPAAPAKSAHVRDAASTSERCSNVAWPSLDAPASQSDDRAGGRKGERASDGGAASARLDAIAAAAEAGGAGCNRAQVSSLLAKQSISNTVLGASNDSPNPPASRHRTSVFVRCARCCGFSSTAPSNDTASSADRPLGKGTGESISK